MREGFLGLQSWGLDVVTPSILVLHRKAAGVRLREPQPGAGSPDSEAGHVLMVPHPCHKVPHFWPLGLSELCSPSRSSRMPHPQSFLDQ